MRAMAGALAAAVLAVPPASAGWVAVRDPAVPAGPAVVGTFLRDAGAISADGRTWRTLSPPEGLGLGGIVRAPAGWVASAVAPCGEGCRAGVLAFSEDGFHWRVAYSATGDDAGPPVALACRAGCIAVAGDLVLTSPDGREWTEHPEAAPDLAGVEVHAVARAAAGWVAVGATAAGGWIGISADGSSWSGTPVPGALETVAVHGDTVLAVGAVSAVSTDGGVTWAVSGFPAEGLAAAWGGAGFLVAGIVARPFERLPDGGVLASPDGTSWSRVAGPYPGWRPAAALAAPQGLLLTGTGGVVRRLAGGAWRWDGPRAAEPGSISAAVAHAGELLAFAEGFDPSLVGPGPALLGRSADGLSWTWTPEPGMPVGVAAAASDGVRVVAAVRGWPVARVAVREPDGSWHVQDIAALGDAARDVTWGPPGFLVVGASPGRVALGADGASWARLEVPGLAAAGAAAAWFRGRYVVAAGRDVATSPDGVAWSVWPGALPLELDEGSHLVAGPGWLTALDGTGRAAYSEDGVTWTRVEGPQELHPGPGTVIRAAAAVADGVVAVGGGWAYRTRDGLHWAAEAVPVPGQLSAVGAAGGRAVAFSSTGAVAASVPEAPAETAWQRTVPVAAEVSGLDGTFWRTELWLANPGEVPRVAWLRWSPRGGGGPLRRSYLIPARGALLLPDVVGELGGAGAGSLTLEAGAPLAAVARSWTPAGEGGYGQALPAAVPTSGAMVLPGLRASGGFRTNLGVAAGPEGAAVTVELRGAGGSALGREAVELGPWEAVQWTRVAPDSPLAWAVVHADRPVAAYASVVDGATGDAVTVLPAAVSSAPLVVPAAAHLPGIGGTSWRTDLDLVAPGPGAARVRVELLPTAGGAVPAAAPVEVPAGGAVRVEDVVAALFPGHGVGALRIVPLEGPVAATSRTFTAGGGGTYGQTVPAVPEAAALAPGETGVLAGLRGGPAAGAWFRTNLGLVNLGDEAAEVEVVVRRGTGEAVTALHPVVPALGYLQLVRVLADAGWAVADGWAVVRPLTPGARVLAWASVVEGATGDPVLVLPVRAAP